MKCIIPRFRKVFCCLPLRIGVIILVYINLIPSALLGIMIYMLDVSKLIFRVFTMRQVDLYHRMYRSKISPVAMTVIILGFWLAEFSMTILALVALHKKNLRLLKIFLHYTVGVTTFIVFVRMLDVIPIYWGYDIGVTLVFAAFKIHFILMQRSLVKNMIENQIEEPKEAQLELVIPIKDLAVNNEMTDIEDVVESNDAIFFGNGDQALIQKDIERNEDKNKVVLNKG